MNKLHLLLGVGLLFLGSACGAVEAESTFTFTSDQFKEKFNQVAKIENTDFIKSSKTTKDRVVFALDDTNFKKRLKALKALNMTDGKSAAKTHIELALNGQGKIKAIDVVGDRSDIINLTLVINTMGVIVRMLDEKLSDDGVTNLISGFGLMRGDNDPSIGKPITNFDKGSAYFCNNQLSQVSMTIGCIITPKA